MGHKRPAAGTTTTQPPRKKSRGESRSKAEARRAPITAKAPLKNGRDTDEDEGDEFDEMSEAGDDSSDDDDDADEEDDMEVDGAESKPKKKKKVTPRTGVRTKSLDSRFLRERSGIVRYSQKLKVEGLKAVMENADEARKGRIMSALKNSVTRIFDNPDKGAVGHPAVHRALWEYLQEVSRLPTPEEQTKARIEMFENCQELLAEMAHTKDGSRAVREFVAWGSAKDHLEKMCLDDQAQLVLFTCLDTVDDTKTLVSSIVNDVVSLAPKLVFPSSTADPSATDVASGRRSLIYLLLPRDPRYFTPALIRTIAETDEIIAQTSKKDAEPRKKEILAGAREGLLKFVTSEAEKLVRDPAGTLVATNVVLHADGDKTAATKALLRPLVDSPFPPPPSSSEPHSIDLVHSSRLYKTLLQGGRFSRESNSVIPVPSYSAINFARSMVNNVGKENLLTMATDGEGAFVLTELLERFIKDGTDEKKELKAWVGSKMAKKRIEGSGAKGKDALLSKTISKSTSPDFMRHLSLD
ncbi:hypothetical protein M407DRAFT_28681 [Tulasnella calospora MUT 4182]|uniref:CPL domain-containing protein n=1 Tax=Tulasnella calospora MUT 4182 TaxID=1051891 RepID=A0A0C3Q106_9AGAM|nr:hypothetical protein M407DRAFT_28681 [Tulasnella calospora MUT 4182]